MGLLAPILLDAHCIHHNRNKREGDIQAKASTTPKEVTQKQNLASRPEAIEFARGFVKEYFTWQRGMKARRSVQSAYSSMYRKHLIHKLVWILQVYNGIPIFYTQLY